MKQVECQNKTWNVSLIYCVKSHFNKYLSHFFITATQSHKMIIATKTSFKMCVSRRFILRPTVLNTIKSVCFREFHGAGYATKHTAW